MCRWNFRGMLEHPRIRKLDYYCRMDTDSRIKKKVRSVWALLRAAWLYMCGGFDGVALGK